MYLMHYGILGMRWGKHRYVDENGNNTKYAKFKGKKIAKVSYKIQAKERVNAMNTINRQIDTTYDREAKYTRKADKAYAKKQYDKSNKYDDMARKEKFNREVMQQNLSDISNGKLKVGTDFVNQLDTSHFILAKNTYGQVVYTDKSRQTSSDYVKVGRELTNADWVEYTGTGFDEFKKRK